MTTTRTTTTKTPATDTTPVHSTGSSGFGARVEELAQLLTDPDFDRNTNLARLQGWRGDELAAATDAATFAQRVGPATCGVMALAVAVTGFTPLLLVTLATAIVGVFANNHAAESVYNVIARRRGRQAMPANRAAKRMGCTVGSLFLGGALVANAVSATTVATILLVALGSLALFVAATAICVPSIVFTLLFGSERGTRRQIIGFARQ